MGRIWGKEVCQRCPLYKAVSWPNDRYVSCNGPIIVGLFLHLLVEAGDCQSQNSMFL